MVKDHSGSEKGNPHRLLFPIIISFFLYAPSHRQDCTCHSLCYTSRGALAGMRNSSMGPPHEGSIRRPIAPWANTLITELHLAPQVCIMSTQTLLHTICLVLSKKPQMIKPGISKYRFEIRLTSSEIHWNLIIRKESFSWQIDRLSVEDGQTDRQPFVPSIHPSDRLHRSVWGAMSESSTPA